MINKEIWGERNGSSFGFAAAVVTAMLMVLACGDTITGGGDCCKEDGSGGSLAVSNITLTVEGRLFTITWSAVQGATGYKVISKSEGCGSGNRTVNTATKEAFNNSNDNAVTLNVQPTSVTNPTARGGGLVTLINDTTVTIWLMAEGESEDELKVPHPSSVSVEIQAITATGVGPLSEKKTLLAKDYLL